MALATTNTTNETPIVIGEMGAPESIVMTHLQARFLLGLLADPDEVDQMVRYLQYDLGDTVEPTEVEPTPVPQTIEPPTLPPLNTLPFDERMEAVRVYGKEMAAFKASQQPAPAPPKVEPVAPQAIAPTPAPEPTPSAPQAIAPQAIAPQAIAPQAIAPQAIAPQATKPKPVRKPRKSKTAPTITIVDTLKPISGISAIPGIPLPSPTATCAVTSPSPTPNVASGTGAEKIASASLERETTNERGVAELRQRAKEVGVTGAIHKMKAETLRARIALAEEKLAAKPVAAPITPAVKTAPKTAKRTVLADFVNTLPDGREVYTAVYDDGSITNEVSAAALAA